MISSRASALLLVALTTIASAQTAPTQPKPATTQPKAATSSTATHATTTAKPSKDSPPGVPKVVGIPRPLYALRYVDTMIGKGPLAQPTVLGKSQADSTIMMYTVHYTGWLTDGTKFDSSVDRGSPITFPVGIHRVIAGWDTGFQGMHVGGKRRLFVPYQLAYGDAEKVDNKTGKVVIPKNADLIFDIEFISQAEAPRQPPPSAKPPAPPSSDSGKPDTTPKSDADPGKPADSATPPADPTKPTAEPAKPQ